MKQKTTIQKIVALFLMLVFTTSIAPKAYFHDLVAHHKDLPDCRQVHHSVVLHQQSFNCHFDDLVVSTPFLLLANQPVAFFKFYEAKKQAVYYFFSPESISLHKENRGPPLA